MGGVQGQSHDTKGPMDIASKGIQGVSQLQELTEGAEVAVRQAAQVQVQALQLPQVSQVRAETLQGPRQTFVTRQVQVSH